MPYTGQLIPIARDVKRTDDEIVSLAFISKKLDDISPAIDALNLWIDREQLQK